MHSTQQRVLQLIQRQIPFFQQHRWQPDAASIWFGQWAGKYHHWVRAQVETLQLLATFISGADANLIPLDPPTRASLLHDVDTGLASACRAHRTDGSLKFEHTTGPWGCGWQSAWWIHRMVRTVHLLRKHLAESTVAAVRRVAEVECDRFIGVRPPSGVRYDTKMEENGWDAPVLAWASMVFPDHPHAAQWEFEARRWAFNALTRVKEKTSWELVDGRAVSQWYAGPSLHPDFTSENHGTFHPNYQATGMMNCITATAYVAHNRPVPEALLYHVKEVVEILGFFSAPDATALMVTGNDWPTFHGMNVTLPLIAHYIKDQRFTALGEANLDKVEWLLDKSDNGHLFGSTTDANIGQQCYFFHTGNAAMLADVYAVMPRDADAAATPPTENAWLGGRRLEYVEVIAQRDAKRMAAAAWRTLYGHPLFTFLLFADTSLAGWAPFTGIGRIRLAGQTGKPVIRVVTHEETCTNERIDSAGTLHWCDASGKPLIRHDIAMEADFGGPMLLRERLTAIEPVELELNEGWCMSVANDLHNNRHRIVKNEIGKAFTVRCGNPQTIMAGHSVRVDDRVVYESDRELTYASIGVRSRDDNGFATTQFDRVIARAGIGRFAAGDLVRQGMLRIAALT